MAPPRLPVLLEDNHLLAILKPPGLPTMGVEAHRDSVVRLAKQYIKQKYHKPHNVYLGVVSRLDAPVTGIILLARTSKAARRLNEQFRDRTVTKTYWALVESTPDPTAAELCDWLKKHERHRKVLIASPTTPAAQHARLRYRTLREGRSASLLEIELETGRKHQIRVQLAARGMPILGDRKYGSHIAFSAGIALHARSLTFEHPVRHQRVTLTAPVPKVWHRYAAVPDDS